MQNVYILFIFEGIYKRKMTPYSNIFEKSPNFSQNYVETQNFDVNFKILGPV